MSAASHPAIACTFADDGAAIAAMQRLAASGAVGAWRVGAADPARAQSIAQAAGAAADLDPADPLAGLGDLVSPASAGTGINMGAAIGGAVGVLGGLAAGETAIASIVPVETSLRPLAATLLFFAVGTAVGAVLGSAFGRRPSTHAGFRLIDGMEAGHVALVGTIEDANVDGAREALAAAGAEDLIVVAAAKH